MPCLKTLLFLFDRTLLSLYNIYIYLYHVLDGFLSKSKILLHIQMVSMDLHLQSLSHPLCWYWDQRGSGICHPAFLHFLLI